jgi:hypothetical protein
MTGPNPKKYEAPVFAIVRIDFDMSLENAITVTKVDWSMETAQAEVARLNELNKGRNCTYLWQTTRLEKREDQ